MLSLSLKLRQGVSLCIADELPGSGCDLSGLQKLVGGTLSQDVVPFDTVIKLAGAEKNHTRFEEDRGGYSYFVDPPDTVRNKALIWRKVLLLSFAARILRGEKIMPVHGCLLKNRTGEGLLLCGQSGMGKTTTAGRWKAAGGEVVADDMVLLEYGADTLYAHPLPTWSRCFESLGGESVSFGETVPLKTILALSRDEEAEAVRDVEGFKYMTAVYSACSLFNRVLIRSEESGRQERLSSAIKSCAVMLYDRFPHRTFFANLQGDIRQTLGFFEEVT